MADRSEHLAAFDRIAALLRAGAAANAHALETRRGTPAGAAVERQLEHTLDRLAVLYGRGSYENRSTSALFENAIENELRLAHEREAAGAGPSAVHAARAHALVDAARRGVRLRVLPPPPARPMRGVYVAPLRPELEQSLQRRREPYLAWRGGAVAVLPETELATLRAAGDEVAVLFLDPDELLDLDGRGDRPALEAELERRLAAARAAPDRVGDSRDRHLQRLLLRQSTLLRNLRDRLAAEHPAAHGAIQPILGENRAMLEAALTGAAPRAAAADPLSASIDHERELQALVTRWAAEPDTAGLLARFQAVAAAGTHLAELERHRR